MSSVRVQTAPAEGAAATLETEKEPGSGTHAADSMLTSAEEKTRLARMGMMTALAIAIHNFPEGLATFLATVTDTKAR